MTNRPIYASAYFHYGISPESNETDIVRALRDGMSVVYIPYQTEAICHAAIVRDASYIANIDNPTLEQQFLAVKLQPHAVRYITNPCEQIQRLVIEQGSQYAQFIDNQLPSIVVSLLRKDINNISYISRIAIFTDEMLYSILLSIDSYSEFDNKRKDFLFHRFLRSNKID